MLLRLLLHCLKNKASLGLLLLLHCLLLTCLLPTVDMVQHGLQLCYSVFPLPTPYPKLLLMVDEREPV